MKMALRPPTRVAAVRHSTAATCPGLVGCGEAVATADLSCRGGDRFRPRPPEDAAGEVLQESMHAEGVDEFGEAAEDDISAIRSFTNRIADESQSFFEDDDNEEGSALLLNGMEHLDHVKRH